MSIDALPPIKGLLENYLAKNPEWNCAVLYLPYCNLRCPYCNSHRLVLTPDSLETLSFNDILERLARQKKQVEGICVSGGEPTIHRGLSALLQALKDAGFKTRIDTNGTQPGILDDIIGKNLADHVALDLKGPLDDTSYSRCSGVYVPVDLIEESIRIVLSSHTPVSFRTTVTPFLLPENAIYELADQLKSLASDWTDAPPKLILRNFDPSDTLDPEYRSREPYDENTLSHIQKEVNGRLGPGD